MPGTAARCWSTSRDGRPGSCTSPRRPASPTRRSTYRNWAGSVGGPIVKNRTFFWFSSDNYEQLGTRNNVLTLPTALERAGDFSQTRNAAGQPVTIYDPLTTRLNAAGQYVRDPFPGNVIPADRINPVARSDSRRHSHAGLRQVVQRRRLAARRSAASADDQDRSALERRVDDHRDVCPSEDARAGLGVLRRVRHDSRRSRRQPAAAHGQLLRPQQRLRREQLDDHRGPLWRQPLRRQRVATFRPSTPRRWACRRATSIS